MSLVFCWWMGQSRKAARADMESAPTVYRKGCHNARCFGGGKTPPCSTDGEEGVGGAQCSPGEFGGDARFLRASNARPYSPAQSLPCVKGGAPQGRRDCDITRAGRVSGKATIPQSASLTPLTRPGPSVAARHLPTLWGVTLYTREPLTLHP